MPRQPKRYNTQWCDALGCLHPTGDTSDCEEYEPFKIEVWSLKKWDTRVGGPSDEAFPKPDGWTICGDVAISLARPATRVITHALQRRIFRPPVDTQRAWERRLGGELPWDKIWAMRSTFATPRDQVTGLKLQHRNLYTVGHNTSAADHGCRACGERENQLHLCTCPILREEFWDPLICMLIQTKMPVPQEYEAFVATGTLEAEKVISRHHSVVWFLGHRCIYAEIQRSREEDVPLDCERALKRAVSMLLSRLMAYGSKWSGWVTDGCFQSEKRVIPRKHRDKKLLIQNQDGDYVIHPAIQGMAQSLNLA